MPDLAVVRERAQRHQAELDRDTRFFSVGDLAARWHCAKGTVRAILDGSKTQTRRVVKLRKGDVELEPDHGEKRHLKHITQWWHSHSGHYHCPYGQPGDLLWVREAWAKAFQRATSSDVPFLYRADLKGPEESYLGLDRWRPSIHMPRVASRITLELAAVRVERVQEISNEDCKAEGIGDGEAAHYFFNQVDDYPRRQAYRALWDSLNAKRGYGWDVNPWVFVLEFRQVTT